jgi:hypothetical protein
MPTKPFETRKSIPGFEGFIVPNRVQSSNTFRGNVASAFIRISTHYSVFAKKATTELLSDLKEGTGAKSSGVSYDNAAGFIELSLEDYPIAANDTAIKDLLRAAANLKQ